jgi:hypothetical protein
MSFAMHRTRPVRYAAQGIARDENGLSPNSKQDVERVIQAIISAMYPPDFRRVYLKDIARTYRNYKTLGDRAIAQVSDADLHTLIGSEDNSVAIIVKHVAGNLRSRFTDFLTTDGEKPDRQRDTEFEMPERATRAEVLQWWESSWAIVLAAIEELAPEDLERTITIRHEPFAVVEALDRSAAHAAYHIGQIVFLAKHLAGANWRSLSTPKGQSASIRQGTFKQGIVPEPR